MPTKSAISFGLVHIPISLHAATTDNDVHFNQLHKDDHNRIRYKKVCGHCGTEVKGEDIVRGYEYEKEKFVVITDDDTEKIKTEKDKTMHIIHFANLNEISPVYFETTYHAIPEMGGDKAYELLRQAMMARQKIGIAKTVMGTKETLLALIPREEGMLVQTMFFKNEVKALPKSYVRQPVNDAELEMAVNLIAAMEKPFEPNLYTDEYQARLKAMIAEKIAGKEIVTPEEKPGNVIDLMEALKASLEQQKPAM